MRHHCGREPEEVVAVEDSPDGRDGVAETEVDAADELAPSDTDWHCGEGTCLRCVLKVGVGVSDTPAAGGTLRQGSKGGPIRRRRGGECV